METILCGKQLLSPTGRLITALVETSLYQRIYIHSHSKYLIVVISSSPTPNEWNVKLTNLDCKQLLIKSIYSQEIFFKEYKDIFLRE